MDEKESDKEIQKLIEQLKNENPDVRLEAVVTLGEIGDAGAVVPLIGALKDRDKRVRELAAIALGEISDVEAIAALADCLNNKDKDVRRGAVIALAKIAEKSESIEMLEKAQEFIEDAYRKWMSNQSQGPSLKKIRRMLETMKFVGLISKRKAELSKGEMLLGDTVKKPKKGRKIYREIRKRRIAND